MTGIGYKIRIWKLDHNCISDKDITASQYHNKDENVLGEYHDIKKSFVIDRNEVWTPRNKRPAKLRDGIKLLEETLRSDEVLCIKWKQERYLQIVFGNGLIADIQVSGANDIERLSFEKALVGKVASCSSAVYTSSFVSFSFENQSKLAFFSLKSEIKMSYVDIPGPQAHLQRNLVVNDKEDMMICWWKFGPWTQTAAENERANIVLLGCSYGRLEVLSSVKSEHDLISLEFSYTSANQILTLEKSYNVRKERHLDTVVYECTRNKIQRLSVISFPLKYAVLSSARNQDEDRLVVGCSDGNIVLFDLVSRSVLGTVSLSDMVPTTLLYQQGIVAVGSGQGDLKIYDTALNPLAFLDLQGEQSAKLEMSGYLSSEVGLRQILSDKHNDVAMHFSGGPLAMLHLYGSLSVSEILHRHVLNDKTTAAVTLLCSVNWNYDGEIAYHGLMMIVDQLLSQPLSHDREVQLEAAFSSFYASRQPISNGVVLKYRHTIGCYARRFFHHLLRYRRFEKAFLLAKDIASADLFLDIYFEAKDLGDNPLARLAKQKANEIIAAESSDSDSTKDAVPLPEVVLPLAGNDNVLDEGLLDSLEGQSERNASSTLKVTNLGYV